MSELEFWHAHPKHPDREQPVTRLHPSEPCGIIPVSQVALLERAHLIGAHHLLGEWQVVARLLAETRRMYPHHGYWSGFLAEIPMSRMHAWRLIQLERHGLAQPGQTYYEAWKSAVGLQTGPEAVA